MDDPLSPAREAFEAGDYRRARALLRGLESRWREAPELAARARPIVATTSADPVQLAILLACLALSSVIAYHYVLT